MSEPPPSPRSPVQLPKRLDLRQVLPQDLGHSLIVLLRVEVGVKITRLQSRILVACHENALNSHRVSHACDLADLLEPPLDLLLL